MNYFCFLSGPGLLKEVFLIEVLLNNLTLPFVVYCIFVRYLVLNVICTGYQNFCTKCVVCARVLPFSSPNPFSREIKNIGFHHLGQQLEETLLLGRLIELFVVLGSKLLELDFEASSSKMGFLVFCSCAEHSISDFRGKLFRSDLPNAVIILELSSCI